MSALHRRAADVGDRTAGHDVRVGGDVGHVHHRADRRVGGGQLGHRLRRRPRRAPRAHDPFELVAGGGATLERREARVVADAEHDHHPPGDAVAARRHGDPAPVGAAVRPARHGVRQAGAEPRLQRALQRVHRRQRAHQVEHRLQQVDVDDLAAAAVQGDHRGERRGEPRRLVGQRHRRQQRLAVRLAVDRGEPAHRLGDRREPGPPGVRAVLAEPRDPRDHEPRVAGVQHVGAEPEPLQPPGPEVLDEHGGVGDEAEQDVAVGVVLEVEHDRALAAVGQLEPQALAVALVAPRHRAQAVAVGALDLDHVGAEVGEVARAVRSGDHRRQVEHADVGERERGRHGATGSTITGTESPARSWAA